MPTIWADDFGQGLGATAPDDRWAFVQGGGYTANDGAVTTSERGLRVVSGGVNPTSGEPAFVQTIPSEPDNPTGQNGAGDHAKWIVYANHQGSAGFQGFDALPGEVLTCAATISGRTYGTAGHPFGAAVADPDDDPRLAAAMLNTIDPETSTAFDFLLTNKRLYAFYGRPNFARDRLGDYASFANTVPLTSRTPDQGHQVAIRYDPGAGQVRWLVNGEEAMRVDRIGYRLSRDCLTLDEGGTETLVRPRQLSVGMGLLSLLDGSWPTGTGLVRLSTVNSYFRPRVGAPEPQTFVDETSSESARLFGQGAELSVSHYVVSTTPAP